MRGESITKETVEKGKSYLSNPKYAELTQEEIALISGIPATTLSRIKKGRYDHLLTPDPEPQAQDTNPDRVSVPIDYDTLKHLMACEYVVDAILKMATLHDVIEDVLFVPNKALYGILRAYVLDDVEKRLEELKEGNNE